ncbi:MAG: 2,3-butanediol dehydrogenase [Microbacterium sp.]
MRAVVFHAKEDVRVEEIVEPEPGPGEVKLRNAFAGICGSDLHVYFSPEAAGVDFAHPHPLTGALPPQVLGHEFSGTVVAIGDGVTNLATGDRVAVWPVYYCGECAACRKGMFNACRTIAFHGLNAHGGGMSKFTTVPASKVHRLPDNVSLQLGALVEPMAVAWHAVRRSGIVAGQRALIAGAGPIGIGVWLALRARGVDDVLVSEPSAPRRAAIQALGATVVDPVSDDVGTAVDAATGGDGVDAAFDAAGVGPAFASALANLTPGGRAIVAAIHERPLEFLPTQLVIGETEIAGTLAYLPQDFDEVIAAMAEGKYDITGWVDEIGYDEVVATFGELRAGRGMKMLVRN